MKKLNRCGEKYVTNEGYTIEIVEYFWANNCTVKFEDGTSIKNLTICNIKNGEVKNPYHPSVYGVGYFGIGKHLSETDKKQTRHYITWRDVLRRCYCKKQHIRQPTYKGCSVDKRWQNFQVFAEWFEENYVEGWALDKDILIKNNKIYSPETCCFVPQEVNSLFPNCKKARGKYPIGVKKYGSKFQAKLSINGETVYLGTFDTPEEAFQAYKIAKEKQIKEVADKWKRQISEQTYRALINYKVEITD